MAEAPPAAPRFAVTIVTYRRNEELDLALDAVMAQTVGRAAMEVCVVHNGGSDAARERWQSRVDCWIDAETNLGCAGGRNRASEATTAPILVFVDDDGIPDLDFVERLGEVLDAHPNAVAVRGRAKFLNHPILTTMAIHYNRGPRICRDLLTLEGAAAVRRSAFEAAGGYDAERVYHEGLDLSSRLLDVAADATILYTPHAVLRHDYAKSLGHLNEKAVAIAAAEDRMVAEVEPHLEALRRRPAETVDGRNRLERYVGERLRRTFHRLVRWHRWRSRVRRDWGV
jgi:GT2 family glycosyltransferase